MMKTQLYRSRLLGIIFFYFLIANLTFVDKLTLINNWELGVNLDYWETNTTFLSSVIFWSNLFLYSILPVLIAKFAIKDKVITYFSLALPIYWGFLLFLSVTDKGMISEVLIPNLKYFIYSILVLSSIVILTKLILLVKSLHTEKKISSLERFEKRALKKLSKLNPKDNEKLMADLIKSNEDAQNLLDSACQEYDEGVKDRLVRMAGEIIFNQGESIELLKKRMLMYSTTSKNERG